MKNRQSKFVVVGAAALGLFASTEAHAVYHWAAVNTCWQDFDVGGGYFCGLRTRQCATAGINDNDRVHCALTMTEGTPLPQTFGQIGMPVPPAGHGISLDELGLSYLIGDDNKIYRQPTDSGGSWGPMANPGMSCISKVAVALSSSGSPRVLALGCDSAKTLRRYVSGSWTTIATNVIDVTPLTLSGTRYLAYLSGDTNRPIVRTGATGSGSFVTWQSNTVAHDSWISNGVQYSKTLWPDRIGNTVGYFDTFSSCTGSGSLFGQLRFRDYFDGENLVDPVCDDLQPPATASSFPLIKRVAGPNGPWTDQLWILTNQARVYALVH